MGRNKSLTYIFPIYTHTLQVGCMLVDGLGDGLMMEGPFDLSFLRTTSFATLQVHAYKKCLHMCICMCLYVCTCV